MYGYVCDTETALYYCQSRYYDPAMGRFINADAFASTGQGILGNNMFAYCGNNPVNYIDKNGAYTEALQWWVSTMWWLCGVDTALPFGDFIFTVGVILYGAQALSMIQDSVTPEISVEEENSSVYQYKEHTKGARQSTKGKHQKGQTRKNRDNRGEKGDARRYYIGNKRKVKIFVLLVGDLLYDDSTRGVALGESIVSGFGGGGGAHSFFAEYMLY